MSDDRLLRHILDDPQLCEALCECCRRGLLGAEGRRIRYVTDNPKGRPIKVTEVIETKHEAIPAKDWRDGQLYEMNGGLRLVGSYKLLSPELGYRPFGWAHVRFDLNELLEFAAKAGAHPTAPATSAAGPSTSSSPKRRRGPTPGMIDRYRAADRALFDEIDALVAQGISVTEAVDQLPPEKIKGRGGPDSRKRRLVAYYRREKISGT